MQQQNASYSGRFILLFFSFFFSRPLAVFWFSIDKWKWFFLFGIVPDGLSITKAGFCSNKMIQNCFEMINSSIAYIGQNHKINTLNKSVKLAILIPCIMLPYWIYTIWYRKRKPAKKNIGFSYSSFDKCECKRENVWANRFFCICAWLLSARQFEAWPFFL